MRPARIGGRLPGQRDLDALALSAQESLTLVRGRRARQHAVDRRLGGPGAALAYGGGMPTCSAAAGSAADRLVPCPAAHGGRGPGRPGVLRGWSR